MAFSLRLVCTSSRHFAGHFNHGIFNLHVENNSPDGERPDPIFHDQNSVKENACVASQGGKEKISCNGLNPLVWTACSTCFFATLERPSGT